MPTNTAHETAVALLKRLRAADPEARTPILRALADVFVSVREHFLRADGTPDWGGRSYAYRQFVRGCYDDAGIPAADLPGIQAAVRYHSGSIVRDRLGPEAQNEYGLQARSPRERSQDRRAARSAALGALRGADSPASALVALSAAYTLLSRMRAETLAELEPREAEVARDTLRDIARRAAALAKA